MNKLINLQYFCWVKQHSHTMRNILWLHQLSGKKTVFSFNATKASKMGKSCCVIDCPKRFIKVLKLSFYSIVIYTLYMRVLVCQGAFRVWRCVICAAVYVGYVLYLTLGCFICAYVFTGWTVHFRCVPDTVFSAANVTVGAHAEAGCRWGKHRSDTHCPLGTHPQGDLWHDHQLQRCVPCLPLQFLLPPCALSCSSWETGPHKPPVHPHAFFLFERTCVSQLAWSPDFL